MTEYPEKAIELLDKYFPKGEKFSRRGEAMVILSMAFIEGKKIGKKQRSKRR